MHHRTSSELFIMNKVHTGVQHQDPAYIALHQLPIATQKCLCELWVSCWCALENHFWIIYFELGAGAHPDDPAYIALSQLRKAIQKCLCELLMCIAELFLNYLFWMRCWCTSCLHSPALAVHSNTEIVLWVMRKLFVVHLAILASCWLPNAIQLGIVFTHC